MTLSFRKRILCTSRIHQVCNDGEVTVPSRFRSAGSKTSRGHAATRSGYEAGGDRQAPRCIEADSIELDEGQRDGQAGLAQQATRPPRWHDGDGTEAPFPVSHRGSGVGRFSHRALDSQTGRRADRAGVRSVVQHGARLASAEGTWLLEPAAHRASD